MPSIVALASEKWAFLMYRVSLLFGSAVPLSVCLAVS